jgi:phage gp36-like protein
MSYAVRADLEARLGNQFSRLYRTAATADEDLADAEAIVDSYVGKRYATPVTNTTAIRILKKLSLDLAELAGWKRAETGATIPEKVQDAGDAAMKMLRDIAGGTMTLAGSAPAESTDAGAGALVVDADPPEFHREAMQGY